MKNPTSTQDVKQMALMSQRSQRLQGLHTALVSAFSLLSLSFGFIAGPSYAQVYGPKAEELAETQPSSAPASLPQNLTTSVEQALAQNPLVLSSLAELAALNSDLKVAKWQRYPALTADVLAVTGGSNAADTAPASLPQNLTTSVEQALAQNPLVLSSLAELAALNSDLKVAKWQRYPALTADVLAVTGGSNAADTDGLALNLALEQPIFTGGGIAARVKAAKISRDVGKAALSEVRYDILQAVITSYYEALLSLERVSALEAGLEEMRGLVVSIERRVAQQVSPLADLTLAQSRLTQLEVEITSARELGENALLRLEELVGARVKDPIYPASELADNLPVEALALTEALQCSPTLWRRRSEVELAEAQVNAARSGLLPQVLLQLSQSELTGARAALVLRLQTGNGLSQFAAAESARARVGRAIADLGQADRQMRTRLRTEFVVFRSSQERAESGLIAVDAADALLESYKRQFVAGRRSWLDVLNAAREKVTARVSRSDARVSVANSATRILALTCRWQPKNL